MSAQMAPQYKWGAGEAADAMHSPVVPTVREDEMVSDDVRHGLPVIIYARWLLVIAGFGLALWNPDGAIQLKVTIVLILALAVGNFFLHVEVARNRPIKKVIIYAASVVDITAVTVVLAMSGTYPSSIYVFYLPALLALSVTFQTKDTAVYTVAAIVAFIAVSAGELSSQGVTELNTSVATMLITQSLVLAALPMCGNVYWRLERERRERQAEVELLERHVSDQFESIETHSASVKAG